MRVPVLIIQDRSAESLQRGQEEIAHLKLEMVTLNKEKNEAVINQSQLQQELQKMQRTFDMERQDSASGRISLERELQELKDRNTALEHQLLEYAETISDLSKVLVLSWIPPCSIAAVVWQAN